MRLILGLLFFTQVGSVWDFGILCDKAVCVLTGMKLAEVVSSYARPLAKFDWVYKDTYSLEKWFLFEKVLSKSGLSWHNHFHLAKMHYCIKIKKNCCSMLWKYIVCVIKW